MKFNLHRFATIVLAAWLVSLSMEAFAQEKQLTLDQIKAALPKLEKFAQEALNKTGVPGTSIAIVFQDQVVYVKGFGVREAGKMDSVTEDTVFQLASVSKPIASTVVAAVISDGKVSWDSLISDLDPEFEMYDSWVTRQLTVRDLFCHRSGLPGEAGTELENIGYERDAILYRLRFMPLKQFSICIFL